MRGLEFFGVYLLGLCALVLFFAFVFGIIWRLRGGGSRKAFVVRMRKQFKEKFPYFMPEKFTPVVTEQSGCCQAMLWVVLFDPPKYYCDKCCKENVKTETGFSVK